MQNPPNVGNTLLATLLTIWVFHVGLGVDAHSGLKTNKQTKKTKPQRTPTPQTKHKPHPSNISFLLFLLNLTDPVSLQSTLGAIKLYQKLFQVKGGMCLLWLLIYMWTSYHLLMEALTSCFGNI